VPDRRGCDDVNLPAIRSSYNVNASVIFMLTLIRKLMPTMLIRNADADADTDISEPKEEAEELMDDVVTDNTDIDNTNFPSRLTTQHTLLAGLTGQRQRYRQRPPSKYEH
jgi:hypothetical protein